MAESMSSNAPVALASWTGASTAPSLDDAASPVIQFTTMKSLFEEINRTTGDILTVRGKRYA